MKYTKATTEDIPQLINMRISYLRDDMQEMTEEQVEKIKKQLPGYFETHLGNDLMAFIVKDEQGVIHSTVLLLIINKPANPHFITGKIGEVLNVYTKPEYRHQGMAKGLMSMLLDYAKEEQLDYVELSATEDGYPLYQKLGFKDAHSTYREMKYIIAK